MFVRKKHNKSGIISIQVIDKSQGKYKLLKTIGSSSDAEEIDRLVAQGKRYIQSYTGLQELDFSDHKQVFEAVLSSISSLKLVGIQQVLGKIFDQIGFNLIDNPLFKDLVLYRLVYPKSKLKTTEYLYRYEHKSISEDEVYRFMDKLHSRYKEVVQQISFNHTLQVLGGAMHAVFYDVTTIYFEIEQEDEIRKTGFSKDGKAQHPQIILGLLVSKDAYPLAYDIFEGNRYEGDTFLPVLDGFQKKYSFNQLTVVADAGLLSNKNIEELISRGYDFILGARIKNEKESIKQAILKIDWQRDKSQIIRKDDLSLIVTYSEARAKKDRFNRERGVRRLEKQLKTGRLTKSSINSKGYNKFLKMEGEITIIVDQDKINQDSRWDGLKGYLTNSKMSKEDILENYSHLWQIEKAFRVAKNELKIRPVYHYKRERIEAHICLNFTAYKIYKELERVLKSKKSNLTPEKVIEILQNIHEITFLTPDNQEIKKTILLTEEQKQLQDLFEF
jgi:transposase